MKTENGRPQFVEIPGTEKVYPADLVLLAMGFVGPERKGLLERLGVELDRMGNVKADANKRTSVAKVFTAGDMTRGQSLIVWAIAEGRHAAHAIDEFLMGHPTCPGPSSTATTPGRSPPCANRAERASQRSLLPRARRGAAPGFRRTEGQGRSGKTLQSLWGRERARQLDGNTRHLIRPGSGGGASASGTPASRREAGIVPYKEESRRPTFRSVGEDRLGSVSQPALT